MLVDVGMGLTGMVVHALDVIMTLFGTQWQTTVLAHRDK